jgi:hypothetical protein
MSNMELKIKINRLVLHSGYEKSEQMVCPIIKIMKMRHKDVPELQIRRAAYEALIG